jgi:hypothetical protein
MSLLALQIGWVAGHEAGGASAAIIIINRRVIGIRIIIISSAF